MSLYFAQQAGEDQDDKRSDAEVERIASSQETDEFGLGVAQIVITAATPMEEIERSFPGGGDDDTEDNGKETKVENGESDDAKVEKVKQHKQEEILDEIDEKSVADDFPTDSAPFPVSSSSGSEADSTSGPSTADNSQSMITRDREIDAQVTDMPDVVPEKVIVGGRASIPDELQPDQLEKLQNLKESNA